MRKAIILSFMIFICSCNNTIMGTKNNSISENSIDEKDRLQEKAIKAYYEANIDDQEKSEILLEDVVIVKDLGIYNHCYVSVITCNAIEYSAEMQETIVEDIVFEYTNGKKPLAYDEKSDKLYNLDTAYQNNLLSYDNIKQIYNIFCTK